MSATPRAVVASATAAPGGPSGVGTTVAVRDLLDSESPLRAVDESWVAALVAAGPPFAPVVVTAEGRLVDGAHRIRAAAACGVPTLAAHVVVAETEAAVMLAALKANREQAKALTAAERKAAALGLLEADPTMSNRAIARATGCSHSSVASWRAGAAGQSTGAATPPGGTGGQSSTHGAIDPCGQRCDHESHRCGPAGRPDDARGDRPRWRRVGHAWRRAVHLPRRWLELLAARLRRRPA